MTNISDKVNRGTVIQSSRQYWQDSRASRLATRFMRVVRRLLSHDSHGEQRRRILHRLLALQWSLLCNYIRLSSTVAWIRLWHRRRRVVVISQVVHMGDIVACEPIIRHVRQQEPGAFIVFAAQRSFRALSDSHPAVDYTLPLYCFTEWVRLAERWPFDRIVDLNIEGRICPVCGVRGKARDKSAAINFDNYYHEHNLLNAYSLSAGLPELNDRPRLYIDTGVQTAIDRLGLPPNFVVIHAAANEPTRALPAASWIEIGQFVESNCGLPVVEIGLVAILGKSDTDTYRNLCGRLSILESAEVIRRCLIYLGTDSGPAHLANAVGAYGIIGLGSYHLFKRYTPYSGNYAEEKECELVRHDGPVNEMSVARMLAAIDRRIAALGLDQNARNRQLLMDSPCHCLNASHPSVKIGGNQVK